MVVVYPLPIYYPPPAYAVYPPYRGYVCPYCRYPLILLPSNEWYCPYHGVISKRRFRFT